MKKSEQLAINEKVLDNFLSVLHTKFYKNGDIVNSKRLRTCNAVVYETRNFYVLKSYNTYIAVINKDSHICYDALRYVYGYTSTSAKHVAKFKNDYGAINSLTFKYV